MAQVVDNELLRQHVAENIHEIETLVPQGTSVHVQLKRISKRLFGADMRLRLFGRWIIVRTHDTDLFHALNRARRHLLRQIDDVKSLRRSKMRSPKAFAGRSTVRSTPTRPIPSKWATA